MSSSTSTGLQVSTATGLFGTLLMTNLGPITSAWSAPSSCYQTTTANTLVSTSVTQSILYLYDVLEEDDGQCNPPAIGDFTTSNPIVCHADNCLRALIREGATGAAPWCSSFTLGTTTQTSVLPTWATQCTDNPISQASSACSCRTFVYSDGSVALSPTLTSTAPYSGYSNYMYYSPAACPEGWETAATFTDLWGSAFSSVTSAYMCCPSGFTSDQDFSNGMMCATAVSKGATITSLVQGPSFTALSDSVLPSSTKILAGALRILYQASDSAALAALTGTVGIAQASTAVTTSAIISLETSGASVITKTVGLSTIFATSNGAASSATIPASSVSTASSGSGTGVKAGIAVGVSVVAVALFLAMFFFFRRRAKRQQNSKPLQSQQEEGTLAGQSIEGTEEDVSDKIGGESTYRNDTMMSSTNLYELSTPINAHEMQVMENVPDSYLGATIHELDNGYGGGGHDGTFHESTTMLNNQEESRSHYSPPWHESGEMEPRELDARPRLPSLHGPELGLGLGLPPSPQPRQDNPPPRMASMESFTTANTARSSPKPGETEEERSLRKQQLKEKMARIKEEKERLQRLQELTSLEEETLREINEHEERSRGV